MLWSQWREDTGSPVIVRAAVMTRRCRTRGQRTPWTTPAETRAQSWATRDWSLWWGITSCPETWRSAEHENENICKKHKFCRSIKLSSSLEMVEARATQTIRILIPDRVTACWGHQVFGPGYIRSTTGKEQSFVIINENNCFVQTSGWASFYFKFFEEKYGDQFVFQ